LITLYTPNLGLFDVDVKIAYGLARVALELLNSRILITPHYGYFRIDISIEEERKDELDEAFRLLCSRMLSAETRYAIPGVSAKYRGEYIHRISRIASNEEKYSIFDFYKQIPKFSSNLFGLRCRHENISAFGGKESGLILGFSGHAGKPYIRDRVSSRKNLGICVVCGALAMLGHQSCNLEMRVGNKEVTFLPIPLEKINDGNFNYLVSAVKTFPAEILEDMPCKLVPLAAIAMHPHLASALSSAEFIGSVHAFEQQKGAWTTRGSAIFELYPIVEFMHKKPFNQASVVKLLRPLRIEPLTELFEALTDQMENGRKLHSLNFARAYAKEFAEFKELLYYKTTEYLLLEVNKMSEAFIRKDSIVSIAKMLNFFVRDRNYGYVDNLRNAKDVITLKEILAKAMRDAQTRRAAGDPVHIPSSTDIQEVIEMSEKGNFNDIKLSITLLALSHITY